MNFLKEIKELIVIVIVVVFLRAFVVEAFNIPSGSMKPTLDVGDFVLVNRLAYEISQPKRGDIVVFKWPVNPQIDFIKRIIGVPGDHIVVKGQTLYINGKEVKWQFVKQTDRKLIYYEYLPIGDGKYRKHLIAIYKHPFVPRRDVDVVVPPGDYFVMGDNRDNSEDSRYWGFVPRKDLIGDAFVIYFSGHVPSLTTAENNPLIGIRQLLLALISPRIDRIGMQLMRR
ncbi:MAG: signal peptidase I [Hydrogenobaculum sp.]|nr:MAG: signal peptidase I [Hydrogenobaculum sp.]HEK25092.1 signal peptidase I [Hydrogenobaculum sp.]